ncbi:MAG: glutamate-5-semialdehyde dehydrogenase [Eubacteriaceae bacterium]|nr:glutamate-5-semialdehyde dehydrogenase [Eubacteriaceae bacterium]
MNIDISCELAKSASLVLGALSEAQRNDILAAFSNEILADEGSILEENSKDMALASENGMPSHMLDRLMLNSERIQLMASQIGDIAALSDPLGIVLSDHVAESGIRIVKTSVPLGVLGIIFESRPNVACDSIALSIKSGNCCLLKGGKEAAYSNAAIAACFDRSAEKLGYEEKFAILLDSDRSAATALLNAVGKIDALIPRGGAGLINYIKESAKVPVIETGAGNCHLYVDSEADIDMALEIADNAKTQRPSVCNAIESLLVSEKIAEGFLPKVSERLVAKGVELRGCEKAVAIIGCKAATSEDFYTEFDDLILAVKVVEGTAEAISHINEHSTKHSDAIITRDEKAAELFLNNVDSACVYWNASTRFTDGGEFGLGAEIGISTQKLHARGPMALKELTSYKYKIYGTGQVRK